MSIFLAVWTFRAAFLVGNNTSRPEQISNKVHDQFRATGKGQGPRVCDPPGRVYTYAGARGGSGGE